MRAAHGAAERRHLAEVITNSGPLQKALPTLVEANPPAAGRSHMYACSACTMPAGNRVRNSGSRSRNEAENAEGGLLSGLNEDYKKHRHWSERATRYEGHRTKRTRLHDYRRHSTPHTRQTGSDTECARCHAPHARSLRRGGLHGT